MTKRQRITGRARGFLRSTRAVSALEYAILVGVIAVGGRRAAIGAFGTRFKDAAHGNWCPSDEGRSQLYQVKTTADGI